MPFIQTTDGIQIHYEIHGDGPVDLIFLHGWGGDGRMWDGVLRRLDPDKHRAIIPDLRGHGQSGCGNNGCNWENFAQDVLAIADHAGAREFVPVGFSMGGKLACYLTAKNRGRIPAQILVAPAAPGMVAIDREAGLQACRAANDWRQGREFFKHWFGPAAGGEIVDGYCQTVASLPQSVLQATLAMTLWTSLADEIGQLDLPTRLVIGECDPVYGTEYQQKQMLPFLRRCKTSTLPSGHFIPLERPAELAALLSQFVSEI